jgi:hypothetical protein
LSLLRRWTGAEQARSEFRRGLQLPWLRALPRRHWHASRANWSATVLQHCNY